jgi:uncharacterized membrane protein
MTRSLIRTGGWALLILSASALALFSLRYLSGNPLVAPVELRASATRNMALFIVHATAASMALLVLPLQLLLAGRESRRSLHRIVGRIYVAGVTIGASAGLLMSPDSFGGAMAGRGFAALALTWLFCTWAGVLTIRAGDRIAHRKWMIRSAALTLSALTLRLYLPFPELLGFEYREGYLLIAWACWLPNLALANFLLARRVQPAAAERIVAA